MNKENNLVSIVVNATEQKQARRILSERFHPGDWHMVFTYPSGVSPTRSQAEETWQMFLGELQTMYQQDGTELCIVHATGYGQKRIHHHAVLTKHPHGMSAVKRLWEKIIAARFYTAEERERGEPLQLYFPWSQLDDSGQYGVLAEYLIREIDEQHDLY